MAQVRFEDVDFSSRSGNNNFKVGFFSLKNDNDEAVVRIMHDSTADFDIVTTHEIREDNAYRGRVSCIRSPREELNKCPMCAANIPVAQRMYIHLIQYVQDETGNIVPQPCVWERSISYANQIKSYIDNYGPLSDIICKIVRHGQPRDQRTRYEIIPNLNKQVYRDDIYVKDASLFNGFVSEGTVVQKRSFDELTTYVQTGKMPQRVKTDAPSSIPTTIATPTYSQTAYVPTTPAYSTPNISEVAPMSTNTPVSDNVPGLQRPTRTYY